VPFQRSMSVFSSPVCGRLRPTAKQLVVLPHETPRSWLAELDVTFGLGMIDQLVPFQCSMSVFVVERVGPAKYSPAAKQLVVLGQVTPNK
jgi:hypothetical protein